MITLEEKDKEYINNSKGTYAARGVIDNLNVIRQEFGKEGEEKIKEEMKKLGYDIYGIKGGEKINVDLFLTFLVVKKQLFNLDDEGVREMAAKAAKFSFFIRFASRFLASLETICRNADAAWHKYHDSGNLYITEVDKEKKRITGEVHGFLGHPVYCLFLEGYFAQIIFFVLGTKVVCREEGCPFKDGGDIHRFVITWE